MEEKKLYVVNRREQIVEEVGNQFEYWIVRLGLTPVVKFIESFLQMILEQIKSYPILTSIFDFINQLLERFIVALGSVGVR